MTFPQTVQSHPASVDAYIRHGWALVPIPANTKGPRTAGWNLRENALTSQADLPAGFGIGLAHAYSGTMALDIDNWPLAVDLLAAHSIDLQALYDAPDAVVIHSGKPGHGKLLYAMPFGLTLASKKVMRQGTVAYEMRCATAGGLTVQDVLPPSIHPETHQPYQWAGKGHWTRLPSIPTALLEVWQDLIGQDTQRTIGTGTPISSSWNEIRQAVEAIPADCSRDEWIEVGMALHWAGTQTEQIAQGLQLWNEWSATSATKYPGERALLTQWESFRSNKATAIRLGTLFHIAKRHGWQRPMPDVSGMFRRALSPSDLIAGLRPPAPDVDLSIWPKVLSERAQEVSEGIGCDPLIPLFAGLSAVCGVIDARIRLELMPGFRVPPVLWLMTIGEPADKKSPGSRPMLAPLKKLEAEDHPRYKKELLEWEGKEAAYATAKKAFLDFAGSPEAMLGGQAPFVPDLPNPPVSLKITVSDVTSQKLVRKAAERPRGLLCYLDEMLSWVEKMTDRTSSEDRSAWVVSYESERYEMDRVGAGSIYCDNLAVSIYGNIQPEVFRLNLKNLSSDGLLQRFIPAILRPDFTKIGNPVPDFMTTSEAWENVLRLVYALPEQIYTMSEEAYTAYRDFQVWYERAKRDERILASSDTFMTAFGKLEGTVGRLILLFHVIENPFNPRVFADTVHRVVSFAKGYIIPAYRYALTQIAGVSAFDKWVAEYIIQYADKPVITLSDIKKSARRPLDGKSTWAMDELIIMSMHSLEQAGWVLRIDDGTREHQHIAEWMINSDILENFAAHRQESIAAKQRQREHIYKLSPHPPRPVYGYEPD